MRSAFVALLFSTAATAHQGEVERSLRLQRTQRGFEALLSIRVPPGLKAQSLLAPAGLAPGEQQQPLDQLLGRRAATLALQGLHLSLGTSEASLQPLRIEVTEAKARATQTGAIEGMALLQLAAQVPAEGAVLELDVPTGSRVRAVFSTPPDAELTLLSGVGRKAKGGLLLRPKPGLPCRIRVAPRTNSPQ